MEGGTEMPPSWNKAATVTATLLASLGIMTVVVAPFVAFTTNNLRIEAVSKNQADHEREDKAAQAALREDINDLDDDVQKLRVDYGRVEQMLVDIKSTQDKMSDDLDEKFEAFFEVLKSYEVVSNGRQQKR